MLRRLAEVVEGDAIVEVALRLADACERAGRLEEALNGLERALQAAPDNTAIRLRLREIYKRADRPPN